MTTRRLFDFSGVPRRTRSLVLACMLFWSILSYLFFKNFVVESTHIVGSSMEPTLKHGERYLVDRWTYRFRAPKRGEIVALRLPGEDYLSVKRIIALPNERLQLRTGDVHMNGKALPEPYLERDGFTYPNGLSSSTYEVAPHCYFVLGDNRQMSVDSRDFGAAHRDWIIGRLTWKIPGL